MRRLAIAILLLAAWPCWAATYYCVPAGTAGNTPTSPYDTWEKAANLPSTCVTAGNTDVGGDGPHIVYAAPGTYADTITLTDADWVGGSIIGTSAAGVTTAAAKGQVEIHKETGTAVTVSVANFTIRNLSLSHTGSTSTYRALYVTADSFTGANLYAHDCGNNAFVMSGATNFLLDGCLVRGPINGATGALGVNTGGTGTCRYCVFEPGLSGFVGTIRAVRVDTTGTVNIDNCNISGGKLAAVTTVGGTINIRNCVLRGGSYEHATTTFVIVKEGGTVNLSNNLIIGPFYSHQLYSGTMDMDTGNIVNESIRSASVTGRRRSVLIPRVDDTENIAFAQDLADELYSRGLHGSYCISGNGVVANAAALQTMHNQGAMEVQAHGWSHSLMTNATNVYSITKVGATITVDRTADQIVVNPGGTVTGYKAKTLAQIQTELEGFGCTVGALAYRLNSGSLGEIMQDSGGAQASPYTPQLLLDTTAQTGFYKVELLDPLTILNATLTGYSARTMSLPYGDTSPDVQVAMAAAGWDGAGGDQWTSSLNLNAVNIYDVVYIDVTEFLTYDDPDADTLRDRMVEFCEWLQGEGRIVCLVSHTAAHCSIPQWSVMLDVAEQYDDIAITSLAGAVDLITAGDWSTSDNMTYTRSWVGDADYSVLSDSPCINAGTNVGLTTDYLGNPVPSGSGYDIGAYEYQFSSFIPHVGINGIINWPINGSIN
jgi:hypothetical protein